MTNLKTWRLPFLAGVLAASACTPLPATRNTASAAPEAETIAISVGPCFGFCPVYNVAIAPEGTVQFEGLRHVAVLGEKQRKADSRTYRALAAELAPYRPASGTSVAVECESAISDTSLYTITWTDPSGRQTVATHHRGCRGGKGQQLDSVLEGIPALLEIAEWTRQITRPGATRG